MLRGLLRLNGRFKTLTKQSADLRAMLIQSESILYVFHLCLHPGRNYRGFAEIEFSLSNQLETPANLQLDFQGKQIQSIVVNSTSVNEANQWHRNGKINIPTALLSNSQPNYVSVSYENEYDKDGNGCVSFIDVDQKQYLYTQFQPYMANRVFPLFDQPNLKAKMTLEIACPSEWETVLSNQFERQGKLLPNSINFKNPSYDLYRHIQQDKYALSVPQSYKFTSFLSTTLLPSYLYCFVVGPYKKLLCKNAHIPMRLYSIQSLYPQLQALAPFIEQTTNKSLLFFQKYFGYQYPFSKYDQIFAHEYKWGAMENAGIVTFNDMYLFKDKVSTQRMLSFGNTIVHELSHHWFGNLVTMKWWDDLWLNESFADYISHFCLEKLRTELTTISFESAMLSFFNRKAWGYSEDQMITTHPIRSSVSNTQVAQSIFDGITYSKGAATMKQLMYLLGEENFSRALQKYFSKYAFANAVLDDLLAHLEEFFKEKSIGVSLEQWKQMWLQRAGTNTLRCEWNQRNTALTVHQGIVRSQHTTLRLHRIKLALFKYDHTIIEQQVLVLPQQTTTVELVIDSASIVAVLPNYQDLTFAKVLIDKFSLKYFQKHLGFIKDTLSRAIIWRAHFEMVKQCLINTKQFVYFALNNLEFQPSDPILEEQLNYLQIAVNTYTPFTSRRELNHSIYQFLRNYLYNIDENVNGNRTVILKDKVIDFSQSESDKLEIMQWYQGANPQIWNKPLNITLKWKIVVKAFTCTTMSRTDKQKFFEQMKQIDPSDTMINKMHLCTVLNALPQELAGIYKSFLENRNLSVTNLAHQMRGFNHEVHKKQLQQTFYSLYFQDVGRLVSGNIEENMKWFVEGDNLENFITHLDPVVEDTAQQLKNKIESFKQIKVHGHDKIDRLLRKKVDQLQKRLKVYKYFSRTVSDFFT